MQPNRDQCAPNDKAGKPAPTGSILKTIGWRGLFLVVWRSTPLPLRVIAFPYGVLVYGKLLAACNNPQSLYTLHIDKYESSRMFKLLRPRYRKVENILSSLRSRDETRQTA